MTSNGPPDPRTEGLFFGKYRGLVANTNDPLKLGRILATVPAVPGMKTNWARPCTPYAGDQVGWFALPPVGASVWIEFEGGNPDYPIWTGCFWLTGQVPVAYELNAEDPAQVKVLKTTSTTLTIDDTAGKGEVKLLLDTPAVEQYPITCTLNSQGVEITTGVSDVKIEPENGVTVTVAQTVVQIQQEAIDATSTKVTITTGGTQVTLTGESINAQTPQVDVTADSMTLKVDTTTLTGAELTVTAESTFNGEVTINGELMVNGNSTLNGALEVQGESNFLGAVTAEGEVNALGALTVEGETNLLGALTVEGAGNILGGLAIEGGVVIAGGGVIDGAPII